MTGLLALILAVIVGLEFNRRRQAVPMNRLQAGDAGRDRDIDRLIGDLRAASQQSVRIARRDDDETGVAGSDDHC